MRGQFAFVNGKRRVLLDQVVCSGDESRLFDCRYRGVGVHSGVCFTAAAICPAAGMH